MISMRESNRFFVLSMQVVFLLALFFSATTASAGTLSMVSDTVSNSAPGATSTSHIIRFTASTAIPASGKIQINFTGGFNIPASLDYTDIDFAVLGVDRTLAPSASPTGIGVSVISGPSGYITFTLASGSGILAGNTVRISIGSVATFGAVGDQFIENPNSVGSRHIRFETKDAADALLDIGSTLIAIVQPVAITVELPIFEPTRTNALPSGLFPGSTQNIWLSLNTDIPAFCRYATSSGVQYSSMLGSTQFASANGGLLHYRNQAVATNTIYSFYVRCQAYNLVVNTTDLLIQFEIGVVPGASSSTPPAPPPPPPAPAGGGGVTGPGGGGGLYFNGGDVTLEGSAAPLSTLVILKDGVIARESTISPQGNFSEKFTNLERGTYSWGAYIRDETGKLSSTYSSTIYLISRTNNIIAPVYLSPTITVSSSTVGIGEPIIIFGYGIPLNTVQAIMNKQGDVLSGKIVTGTTTANGNGSWTLVLSSDGLPKGTYEIKVQSLLGGRDQSLLSSVAYVGVGENPNPDFVNRSDLNKDKKVNLTDFSILLFNWNSSDVVADINQDGTVNLVDFSIMLANWTG